MKKMIKIAALAVMATVLTQSSQATSIVGSIGFTGTGVTYNGNGPGASSAVTSWISPYVASDTGAFSTISFPPGPSSPVTFINNNTTTWLFNSGAVANFWKVGGFTFNLISSSIISQGGTPGVNGFVVVNGIGTVSGNSYDPTLLTFNFTSNDPLNGQNPNSWTFSASSTSNVPDGASTAMLLGVALSGVALLKRKLMA